jgi:hypothetical protein
VKFGDAVFCCLGVPVGRWWYSLRCEIRQALSNSKMSKRLSKAEREFNPWMLTRWTLAGWCSLHDSLPPTGETTMSLRPASKAGSPCVRRKLLPKFTLMYANPYIKNSSRLCQIITNFLTFNRITSRLQRPCVKALPNWSIHNSSGLWRGAHFLANFAQSA